MNLFLKKGITLTDALYGTQFAIKHLDNRILKVSTKGTIVSPREVRCIENEGMPLHTRPFVKGALFVEFDVKFPNAKNISSENLEVFGSTVENQIIAEPTVETARLETGFVRRGRIDEQIFRGNKEQPESVHSVQQPKRRERRGNGSTSFLQNSVVALNREFAFKNLEFLFTHFKSGRTIFVNL
ncbi:DnaJ (Hsp40), subfamily A, member 4 [Bonamia ostreae]|uniref:DnaJ (Hsp40), subfamily A, member 4 n=1 Tax=Bonamia ostreae TaxID=126728 RepID=A0ABV2ATC6_9EUKA